MDRQGFSIEELTPTGCYYDFVKLPFFPDEYDSDPILNKPVTAEENWKLLLSGKTPYWIPLASPFVSDVLDFRPRFCPDNFANHQCFDGEPMPDWSKTPLVTKSWFGLEWEFVPEVNGATIHPGHPLITDMNEWEELEFPDIDSMDFVTMAEKNKKYLGSSKYKYLSIQCSFFERLMALMDTAEACMAIIDDDQKDAIRAFFSKYSDFLINYIKKIKEVLPMINGVYIHDDWAHQNGPFISPNTAREMLVPYTKKVIDAVHGMGMYYTVHCCGNAEMMIPLFIEMGVDIWDAQETANDLGTLAKKYKDSKMVFQLPPPEFDENSTDEEIDKAAYNWVQEYKDCHVALETCNMSTNAFARKSFLERVYVYSRIEFDKRMINN